VAPEIMGVGPIKAVRRVLRQARMTLDDVDVVELNEAFAAQVLPTNSPQEPPITLPFGRLVTKLS
jgi:acetyl-CoA acetyltransferase